LKSLAFFSPFSPVPSGVAHYADNLAVELAGGWDINFYIDGSYRPEGLCGLGRVRDHRDFRGREDLVLYQASNGPFHAYMYPHILEHGGIVTLHDSTLHDMVITWWEGRSRAGFWSDFFRTEGWRGLGRALAPIPGGGGSVSERILHNLYLDERDKRNRFPFLGRVARTARGIITHSRLVARAAEEAGAQCPVLTVPLAVDAIPEEISRLEARRMSGLLDEGGVGEKTFLAMVFGYIQPHKRIGPVLDAWKKFMEPGRDAVLMLVGPTSPGFDIEDEVRKRGVGDKVIIKGEFVPMEQVWTYVYSADFCLNLRWPVYGSSSQTLVQLMAAGRPCVVTDAETFSELPDDVVKKIPCDENETEHILEILEWAVNNPVERKELGRRAGAYVKENCLWSRVGAEYDRFLREILSG